ncbi:MAG: hypothetical protein ACLTZT_15685 [Butyricimonas faecalis]
MVYQSGEYVSRTSFGMWLPVWKHEGVAFEEAYYGVEQMIFGLAGQNIGTRFLSATEKYPNSVGDFKLAGNIEYRFVDLVVGRSVVRGCWKRVNTTRKRIVQRN